MKQTDGSMGFRISTLEDAPGVTWVAGDEQTIFLPGRDTFNLRSRLNCYFWFGADSVPRGFWSMFRVSVL